MKFQPIDIEESFTRVTDGRQAALHCLNVAGVVVAKRGGHLPGSEVQVTFAARVENRDPFCVRYDGPLLEPSHVGALWGGDHPTIRDFFDRCSVHPEPPHISASIRRGPKA